MDDRIMVLCLILTMEYILVFLATMADLWSGVRKARARGEARTSYGFRRTVEKLAKYYNVLIAVTVVDIMQIVGIHYLDKHYDYDIPLFPIMTFISSILLGLIEIKSIYEKADDKDKDEYHQVALLATEMARHRTEPEEIARLVAKYMRNEINQHEPHYNEED